MPEDNDIRINMDGRGTWRDNAFVKRLWSSVEYEEIYLHAYLRYDQTKTQLGAGIEYYNNKQKHQTPSLMYDKFSGLKSVD